MGKLEKITGSGRKSDVRGQKMPQSAGYEAVLTEVEAR